MWVVLKLERDVLYRRRLAVQVASGAVEATGLEHVLLLTSTALPKRHRYNLTCAQSVVCHSSSIVECHIDLRNHKRMRDGLMAAFGDEVYSVTVT